MATRRSKRTSGVKLSERFDELTAEAKHSVFVDKRLAQEAKYADVTCKFTIFDLIPELRLRIYAYAMSTDEPRDMSRLKAPAMVLVSKQVRSEAWPVFFSQCQFSIPVISNYSWKSTLDDMAKLGTLGGAFQRRRGFMPQSRVRSVTGAAGGVYFHRKMRDWLERLQKKEGITIAFRNVDFELTSPVPEFPPAPISNWRGYDPLGGKSESSVYSLHVPIAPKPRPKARFTDPEPADYLNDLALLRDRATAVADEIAASRERFVGYTLDELREVAKAFKYWPEGQPRP